MYDYYIEQYFKIDFTSMLIRSGYSNLSYQKIVYFISKTHSTKSEKDKG